VERVEQLTPSRKGKASQLAKAFRSELVEKDVKDEWMERYQPQKASPYGKKKRSK